MPCAHADMTDFGKDIQAPGYMATLVSPTDAAVDAGLQQLGGCLQAAAAAAPY